MAILDAERAFRSTEPEDPLRRAILSKLNSLPPEAETKSPGSMAPSYQELDDIIRAHQLQFSTLDCQAATLTSAVTGITAVAAFNPARCDEWLRQLVSSIENDRSHSVAECQIYAVAGGIFSVGAWLGRNSWNSSRYEVVWAGLAEKIIRNPRLLEMCPGQHAPRFPNKQYEGTLSGDIRTVVLGIGCSNGLIPNGHATPRDRREATTQLLRNLMEEPAKQSRFGDWLASQMAHIVFSQFGVTDKISMVVNNAPKILR